MNTRELLSAIYLLIISAFTFSSCSKDKADQTNNLLSATIIPTTGSSFTFSSSGKEVVLGCGFFGSSIDATADSKRISLTVSQGTGPNCVSNEGAFYLFACSYTPSVNTTNPVYSNVSNDSRNELTFTTFRDDFWEGHFTTTCYTETDSVHISGTFKGDPRLY